MTETISHIAAKKINENAFTVLPNVTISFNKNKCLVIHAPQISDEIIITNDLVELVDENKFIFLGRADNVINSGGVKLIPEQIELKLADKIQSRFFIHSKEDLILGEKLILVIEGEQQSLSSTLFDDLEKYENPKEIIFVQKFKETGNGKIIRKESLL